MRTREGGEEGGVGVCIYIMKHSNYLSKRLINRCSDIAFVKSMFLALRLTV